VPGGSRGYRHVVAGLRHQSGPAPGSLASNIGEP